MMMTTRAFIAVSLVALALPVLAQGGAGTTPAAGSSDAARIERLRERIRKDPKALVAQNLQLTEAEAKGFWPVYDECHLKLDATQRRVNRAILDYVNAMNTMTDANAKQIAKDLLAAEKDEASARQSCFDRVAKVLPGKKAARYLQIESKIQALVHFDAAVAIPLID
jgi:hypothetical protein